MSHVVARRSRGAVTFLVGAAVLLLGVAGAGAAVASSSRPTTTSVAVSTIARSYGTASTATVTVRDPLHHAGLGRVLFSYDGTGFAFADLDGSGRATVTVPARGAIGRHTVSAHFLPSARSSESESAGAKAFDIVKITPRWSIAAPAVTVGRAGSITATLTGPVQLHGRVSLRSGGRTLVRGLLDGHGTVRLPVPASVAPPAAAFVLVYDGDAVTSAAQRSVTVPVSRLAASVSLTPPGPSAAQTGGTATVVVTAAGRTPTGSVTLLLDGRTVATGTLSAGRTALHLPAPSAGAHTLVASYAGDRYVAPASSPARSVSGIDRSCPTSARVCVDLTHSMVWLQSGGRISYGPVRMTSGRPGYRTEDGTFQVFWKDRDHHSSEFGGAPMPNAVFFDGGEAFHAGSLSVASHGCVHLAYADSEAFFSLLHNGDEVVVFGYAPY